MAGSYTKFNGDIRTIDRAAIKDVNGDYRIVKKVYAKVDVSGSLFWEPVLTSKGLYNIVFNDRNIDIVSVENFEVEKTIDLNFEVDKVVYGNNQVLLHEYANFNRTARIDMTNLTIDANYEDNWLDVDADINGNVYLLASDSVTVKDNQGGTTNYNVSLQTGEDFTRFCVDKDGFCYCLTTNDRFFKLDPIAQSTPYSITLGTSVSNDEELSVDDTNVYIGTDFNIFISINKNTGADSTKIISFQRPKKIKTDNEGNVFAVYQETSVGKFDLATSNLTSSYTLPAGFNITDFDVSLNGNIYITASDGSNYKVIKTDSNLQETYNSGNIPVSGSGSLALGIFPGNVGGGFWQKYVN